MNDGLSEIERRFLDRQVPQGWAARPLRGGRNNRLFAIDVERGRRAVLKTYPQTDGTRSDRFRRESTALTFLADQGEIAVPALRAVDSRAKLLLMEFVPARKSGPVTAGEIGEATAFLARLHAYSGRSEARRIGDAAEACRTERALRDQLERRLARLRREGLAMVQPLLNDGVAPLMEILLARHERLWERARKRGAALAPDPTLSPSDFSLHNAGRRRDGRLVFFDFEYFGWDDPVKLVAESVWHPALALEARGRALMEERLMAIFSADADFGARLERCRPLYLLRWLFIVLNEFLPHRWDSRQRAGAAGGKAKVLGQQMEKARRLMRAARRMAAFSPDR
jgi:hypothetical protein